MQPGECSWNDMNGTWVRSEGFVLKPAELDWAPGLLMMLWKGGDIESN